eukprot:tig00000113_g5613.t1
MYTDADFPPLDADDLPAPGPQEPQAPISLAGLTIENRASELPDALWSQIFQAVPCKGVLRAVCRAWKASVDEHRTRLVLHGLEDATESDVDIVARWIRRSPSLAALEVQASLPLQLAERLALELRACPHLRELRLRPNADAALAAYDSGPPRLFGSEPRYDAAPPPGPPPPVPPGSDKAFERLRSALVALPALECLEIDLGPGCGHSAHGAALSLLSALPPPAPLAELSVTGGPNGSSDEIGSLVSRLPTLRSLRVSPGLGYAPHSSLWARPPPMGAHLPNRRPPPDPLPTPPPPPPRVRPIPSTSFFHFRPPPSASSAQETAALQRLDLSGSDLGNDAAIEPLLAAVAKQCPTLAHLSLADCRIEGTFAPAIIGRILAELPELITLSIADNPLGSIGFDSFWRGSVASRGRSRLREIDASNCLIDDCLSGSASVGLAMHAALSTIRLAGNRTMGFASARFLAGLRTAPRRCELIDLRHCGIGSTQSMQKIGEIFHGRTGAPSVERLVVSHNGIVDDDIQMLEFIPGTYHITRMDFSHNNLSRAGVERLCRALEPGRNPELAAIDISYNPAVDERTTLMFAASVSRNPNIRDFGIGGHRLGMIFVFGLPRAVLDLVYPLRQALEAVTTGPLLHLDLSGVPLCTLDAVLDAVRKAGAGLGPEARHVVLGEAPRKTLVAFSAAECRVLRNLA